MEIGYIIGGILLCGGGLWGLAALADWVDPEFISIPALLMICSIAPFGITHDKLQQEAAVPIRAASLRVIANDWYIVQHVSDTAFNEQYTVERHIGNTRFRGVLVPAGLKDWKVIKQEVNTDGQWKSFSESTMKEK